VTGPLAATDAGGTSRPHRALKLQEYVEELAERPPINEVPEVDRGAAYRRSTPALRIPRHGQPAHANALQRQGTRQSPEGWPARKEQGNV
jgi:hypothetical protein